MFTVYSQERYIARNGKVSFFSDAPLEKIEAVNTQVSCVLDTKTGDIVFQIRMLGFHFERALMEEHFNEKYVESEEYPKSIFIGKINDWKNVSLDKEKKLSVSVLGDIEIHGVKKEIEAQGTIQLKKDKITLLSNFILTIADFDIKIPNIVKDKIAKKVQINVDVQLERI